MESAPSCGICSGELSLRHRGSGRGPTTAALSPTNHVPGAYADLFTCRHCGTVQQPALLAADPVVDLYRGMRDDAYLAEEAGRRATASRLLGMLGPAAGRLLEVGCGHGLLLDEARHRGWSVLGLEPADAARAHARDVLGLEVLDGTLDDLPGTAGFAAIVLADVLEHLEDPVGALRACRARLVPGGALLVVTPDPGSLTARLAGARWWGYLPSHTFLLPRRTLRRVLADAGFAVLADRGYRRSFTLGYWLAGLLERSPRLGSRLAPPGGSPLLRRQVTCSLGDERVILARAAQSVAAAPAPTRSRAAVATS